MRRIFLVLLCASLAKNTLAQTVTNLNGFFRYGQVFLTWQNMANGDAYYKVYRSLVPIVDSSQLLVSEYLGCINKHSAKDQSLSNADQVDRFLRITPEGPALSSGSGLFVSGTLVSGHFYYAVTSIENGVENKTVVPGANSIQAGINETVEKPQPVFQEERIISGKAVQIYAMFYTFKKEGTELPHSSAGFISNDFAVSLNGATGINPLKIYLHGGGSHFLRDITSVTSNEVNLHIEDYLPNGESSGYFGYNENYDIFKTNDDNSVPSTGTNYNSFQQVINLILDWAVVNLPVDSNRIYLKGGSKGAAGVFFYTITYPERIAATVMNVPVYNYAFTDDYQNNCTLNSGNSNRNDGDKRYGTIASNLPSNLGAGIYNALNGGWVLHAKKERSLPVMIGVSGKNDKMVGWTEKTFYYDSVNTNYAGGYYFWDSREHAGEGKTWNDFGCDYFRYRNDRSYPAFAWCSLNEDFGDGTGTSGESFGTINGALDWKDEITDDTSQWEVKVFVRNLVKSNGEAVIYPDSATADIAPRRLQNFNVPARATIHWSAVHQGEVIQSGSFEYTSGIIVIPQVKIFRDTTILTLTYSVTPQNVYYGDSDLDGYGDPFNQAQAAQLPEGYVVNNSDCNDKNAEINPAATEPCNSVDDDCNGIVDDHSFLVPISPEDSVSYCKGVMVTLSTTEGTHLTYQWYKNDVAVSGGTNSSYSTTKKGTFYVAVSNGMCTITSASTIVNHISDPNNTVTAMGSLDICETGSVKLKAKQSYYYQWQLNGSLIEGATTQKYVATVPGVYSVIVSNSFGCSKTSTTVTVTSSCKSYENNSVAQLQSISIYPNPSNGNFSMELKTDAEDEFDSHFEVINAMGQVVYAEKVIAVNGNIEVQLDLQDHLVNGMYLIRIRLSNGLIFLAPLICEK